MTSRRASIAIAAGLLLAATVAHAQSDGEQRIVVRRHDSSGVGGYFRAIGRDSITLFDGRADCSIARAAIARVELIVPATHSVAGDLTLWGAFVGMTISEVPTEPESPYIYSGRAGRITPIVRVETLLGAASGLVIGLLIDGSQRSGRDLYPIVAGDGGGSWEKVVRRMEGIRDLPWRITGRGGFYTQPARDALVEHVASGGDTLLNTDHPSLLGSRRVDIDRRITDGLSLGAAAMLLDQHALFAQHVDTVGGVATESFVQSSIDGWAALAVGRLRLLEIERFELAAGAGAGVASMAVHRRADLQRGVGSDDRITFESSSDALAPAGALAVDVVYALSDHVQFGAGADALFVLGELEATGMERIGLTATRLPMGSIGAGFVLTARF